MKDQARLLARYQRLRDVGRAVNTTIASSLSKEVLHEGGKALGLLRGSTLSFADEHEMAVLMDFCIHDIRRQGLTAVERFLAESPYRPGSDEQVYAEALKDARFSLFLVEGREPGVGVQVRDLLDDSSHFVFEMSLSRSASPDLVMAWRQIAPEGIGMTTGGAVPVGTLPASNREGVLQQIVAVLGGPLSRAWAPEQRSEATATLLSALLKSGAMAHIATSEPSGSSSGRASGQPSVGRYDPCPCGSGKKFKFCCGGRRR